METNVYDTVIGDAATFVDMCKFKETSYKLDTGEKKKEK